LHYGNQRPNPVFQERASNFGDELSTDTFLLEDRRGAHRRQVVSASGIPDIPESSSEVGTCKRQAKSLRKAVLPAVAIDLDSLG